ncbi:Adhesin family protein [Granulibacter bethesdensis]|nr:Adhesin family protein [Granulibacter bethesdensis]
MVPAGVNAVRILSNASRPCDVTGPFLDDRRNLGVLIGEAVLYDSGMTHTLNAHLEHEGLEGWHNPPPYEASTGACSGPLDQRQCAAAAWETSGWGDWSVVITGAGRRPLHHRNTG